MHKLPLSSLALALLVAGCSPGLQKIPTSPPAVESTEFSSLMARTARAPWVGGNRIATLENGRGFFPPMLRAIREAKKTVTFETFVYMKGYAGHEFSVAFANAARRGVKVHVILDAVGSRGVDNEDVKLMKRSGVEFHYYRPITIRRPLSLFRPYYFNNRTHRKILVTDGRLAFTGGAGYTDSWLGNADNQSRWRDTQYEIRGPVVRQLQEAFNNNWKEVAGVKLRGPEYFPPLSRAGNQTAHFSVGAPRESGDTLGSSMLLAIRSARKSILIEHSYFIPNKPLLDALLDARQRGVHVEVLVCGEHTDCPFCRSAQRPALLKLVRAGAEIWEYHATMMHGKLVVVDGHFSAVGSANFDDRSFFINDEANLNVLDSAFAREQIQMFERDKLRCHRLTPADLKFRLKNLPGEWAAGAVKAQL